MGFDLKESAGGAFSYTDRLIQLIDEYQFPKGIEICFVNLLGVGKFQKATIGMVSLPSPLQNLIKSNSFLYHVTKSIIGRYLIKRGIKKQMDKKGVKLMFYIHQGECLDSKFPFISTNWDIGHRSTHAYPELMYDGKTFEVRDYFYQKILPKALMIFCESETGKSEIMKYTNIGEHKIRVFPMFGGSVTKVNQTNIEAINRIKQIGLEQNNFFFYPAQFWPHKNHVNLIKAFSKISKSYPTMN